MSTPKNPYEHVTDIVGTKGNIVEDFLSFMMKGNVIDLAVGSVLGATFSSLVNTLSSDTLVPLLSSLVNVNIGGANFYVLRPGRSGKDAYPTLSQAEDDGATIIKYGLVIEKTIAFVVHALALYFLIRAYIAARRQFHLPKT